MGEVVKYPFEFDELLITDRVLDKLGFSEYWAGSSDYGERTFGIKKSAHEYERWYRIIEHDEKEDESDGYNSPAKYSSQHWSSPFKAKQENRRTIYFLHDLYNDIKENAPDLLDVFVEKTKEKGVNMYPFIESYLKSLQ